jgi:hypothetical protein
MFEPNQILTHRDAPDLGRLRVNAVSSDHLYLVQENSAGGEEKIFQASNPSLVLAADQSPSGFPARRVADAVGAKKKRVSTGAAKKPLNAWPFEEAYKRFEARYPGGFNDAAFAKDERDVKAAAVARWQEQFGPAGLAKLKASKSPEEVAKAFIAVNAKGLNLLHPIEFKKFTDALKASPASLDFVDAVAAAVAEGSLSEAGFNAMVKAFETCGLKGPWTVLTLWAHLAAPKGFPFLKPAVTKAAADGLGHSLNYETKLNWATYQKTVELYDKLWALLEPKGAKDWRDVQSFLSLGWS